MEKEIYLLANKHISIVVLEAGRKKNSLEVLFVVFASPQWVLQMLTKHQRWVNVI